MFRELECSDPQKQKMAIGWVVNSTWPLALTRRGSRIVQRAMELATTDDQERIVEKIKGFVLEALQSPHANYVLQKCLEVMPPQKLEFVARELKGQAVFVAKHRFGCRILQRAIEHWPPAHSEDWIQEVLTNANHLVRHEFGNYVIQHILQFGTSCQKHQIADILLTDATSFAKHKIASHVVCRALSHCLPDDVQRLNEALSEEKDLSRTHNGSFVVREANRINKRLHAHTLKGVSFR